MMILYLFYWFAFLYLVSRFFHVITHWSEGRFYVYFTTRALFISVGVSNNSVW